MSLSQLTTLITETEERLTQMKSLVAHLQEKAAKKASKKTSKKPDFAPEFSDEGGMFDSDVPRTPVSKKGKHVPDAPKKPAALPVLPKSPVAPPAAEPEPEKPKLKKEPNSWILFTIHVNEVLKNNEVGLPGAEQKQFCGALKAENENYKELTDDAILDARKTWVKPDVSKQFLAGKNKTSDSGSVSVSDEERWARNCRPLTDQHGRPLPK